MDKFLSDPAGRLYRFLEHCAGAHPNISILEGWRIYLDLPDGTGPGPIISGIAPLFVLPDVVEDLLRSTEHAEENLEDYTPALTAARAAMSVVAEATNGMSLMKQRFDTGHVQSLRSCSRLLQRLPGVGAPSDDQLAEVRDSAQALIDSINDATGLPAAVRETLLGYAYSAIHDVDLFKIGGADALIREAKRLRGQLALDPWSMVPPPSEKGVLSSVKRLAAALGVIALVVHTPVAIGADLAEYKKALTSITEEVPADFLAPGRSSPPALEAPTTHDSV
ncbi:hypothetical protein [Curtobacterium luteum]|uniref:hypothetical protein n=1 Tax=Curtobacterium luteum TaxID=33881 RepID=UPI0037FE421E